MAAWNRTRRRRPRAEAADGTNPGWGDPERQMAQRWKAGRCMFVEAALSRSKVAVMSG